MTKQHGRGRLLRLWHARCLCRAPGGLRPPSAKLTAWGRQAGRSVWHESPYSCVERRSRSHTHKTRVCVLRVGMVLHPWVATPHDPLIHQNLPAGVNRKYRFILSRVQVAASVTVCEPKQGRQNSDVAVPRARRRDIGSIGTRCVVWCATRRCTGKGASRQVSRGAVRSSPHIQSRDPRHCEHIRAHAASGASSEWRDGRDLH